MTTLKHTHCPRCGSPAQTENSGGNPDMYFCGSNDKWASRECIDGQIIAQLTAALEGLKTGACWCRQDIWHGRHTPACQAAQEALR